MEQDTPFEIERIAEPDEYVSRLRMEALIEIARGCIRERSRIKDAADQVAEAFWSAEATYLRTTGNRFKYTPKIALRSWTVTIAWQRKCSTIYYSRHPSKSNVGPKWKYLKLGRRKRYSLSQFTARGLSERERIEIDKAETEFALLRMQGKCLPIIAKRITHEAKLLGFQLRDMVPELSGEYE